MLSSRVKIWSFRGKAHLVFHWCLYNKWRLLCLFSFKYFSQQALLWKLGNIIQIFNHVTRLHQTRASENIWWIIHVKKNIRTVDTASDWLIATLCNIIPYLTPSAVILVLLRSNVSSFGIPKLRNSSTCSSSISLFKEDPKPPNYDANSMEKNKRSLYVPMWGTAP